MLNVQRMYVGTALAIDKIGGEMGEMISAITICSCRCGCAYHSLASVLFLLSLLASLFFSYPSGVSTVMRSTTRN